MAGLLVRELKVRGLVERVLVVCPANLSFQPQDAYRGPCTHGLCQIQSAIMVTQLSGR